MINGVDNLVAYLTEEKLIKEKVFFVQTGIGRRYPSYGEPEENVPKEAIPAQGKAAIEKLFEKMAYGEYAVYFEDGRHFHMRYGEPPMNFGPMDVVNGLLPIVDEYVAKAKKRALPIRFDLKDGGLLAVPYNAIERVEAKEGSYWITVNGLEDYEIAEHSFWAYVNGGEVEEEQS